MNFGFDVISDLYLDESDDFDWDGKPTSLYCILAGNIACDINTLYKTFKHLSNHYQGVFFIDGTFEHPNLYSRDERTKQISKLCDIIPNVVYLHNNVVIVDGIALVGVNGWYGNSNPQTDDEQFHVKSYRFEDIIYLEKTIQRLQLHVDVKKIVVVSNSVPSEEIYMGESHVFDGDICLSHTLVNDTEHKTVNWVFGSYKKIVDITKSNINYSNNPCYDRNPYYPKRIDLNL
jgi:hypothetical protein